MILGDNVGTCDRVVFRVENTLIMLQYYGSVIALKI